MFRLERSVQPDEIFNIIKTEARHGEMTDLSPDFYVKLRKKIEDLKNTDDETNTSTAENVVQAEKTLKTKRMQKILIYLAYNKQLPARVPEEERSTYERIKQIINETSSLSKTTKVKITTRTPEIINQEGKKIGPFEQNQVVELDKDSDINFIISNKIGVIIN